MNAPAHNTLIASPTEQMRYAAWLDAASKLGFVMLVVAYVAYAFGLVAPQVPLDSLPALWSQPAAVYIKETGEAGGWSWLMTLGKGESLNLLGIAVLAGGSLPCLLAVIPLYARRRERIYVLICGLQVAVLLLAASGLLRTGH